MVASLFGQLVSHFPRLEFAALVKMHDSERGAKGFTCSKQLVSMLFYQLAKADSLREICNGLICCVGKVVHLRIAATPTRLPIQDQAALAGFFDQHIWIGGAWAEKKYPYDMRRVVVWYPVRMCTVTLLANHLEFGASTIALIYIIRWKIGIFFKTHEQPLKVKTFVGTS